jgi:hypothetical protein
VGTRYSRKLTCTEGVGVGEAGDDDVDGLAIRSGVALGSPGGEARQPATAAATKSATSTTGRRACIVPTAYPSVADTLC